MMKSLNLNSTFNILLRFHTLRLLERLCRLAIWDCVRIDTRLNMWKQDVVSNIIIINKHNQFHINNSSIYTNLLIYKKLFIQLT